MDMYLILLIGFFIIGIIGFFYLYNLILGSYTFLREIEGLITRTFREYYKGEDIEPVIINNGIDLIWKGEVEGSFNEDNKLGFITIFTNDGDINSPIRDHKEADIIAGKISNVVYEYIKDRE